MNIKVFECPVCKMNGSRPLKEYNRNIKERGVVYCSNSCATKARRKELSPTRICKCGVEYSGHNKAKKCPECWKIYYKQWYQKNKETHKERTKLNKRKSRAVQWLLLLEYFKTHPCIDCGNSNPIVLDFDHRGNKFKNVSEMRGGSYSWERTVAEIEKCDVRCANCHRIKTAKERNYYKYLRL